MRMILSDGSVLFPSDQVLSTVRDQVLGTVWDQVLGTVRDQVVNTDAAAVPGAP